MRDLLRRGNNKLGENIHTWSLPAASTCPGRSPLCERHCYALHGRYKTSPLQLALAANLRASANPSFASTMIKEVRRRACHVVRVHVSGDFYSPQYAQAWAAVMGSCRKTRFYAYTRSWREPPVLPALREMASLPNCRLWFSCDRDTGLPPAPPPGVRLCWLQDRDEEVPERVHLVFRTRGLRKTKPAHTPLKLVCPPERPNPSPHATCGNCGKCWS